jgi:hypothetical protein
MTAAADTSFYDRLAPMRDAAAIFDDANYVTAPSAWLLAVSDIQGSTQAVAEGRHSDVNFSAAAMIAALTNLCGQIPYQFGGDGATALVPPGYEKQVRTVLARVRAFALRDFKLNLRIGLVPVQALAQRRTEVLVGRYEASPGSAYAVFRGGGIDLMESSVKGRGDHGLAHEAMIGDHEDDGEPPDLTGLSCRWTPIKAARGSMVSLVMRCADHSAVHMDIARVAGLDSLHAFTESAMVTRWPPKGLVREAKARRGRVPLFLMVPVVAAITFVAYLFVKNRWNTKTFNANKYVKEVAEGAVDFARSDQSLCVVFDCPQDRIAAVRAYLDDRAANSDFKYGMHISDHAVMTCLVVSPNYGQHVHFVDGGDGGYTQAATQLKAQA